MLPDYPLGAKARVICSGEIGQIIGRAEYTHYAPQVMLRYKAADGRAVEAWWALEAVEVLA